MTIEDDFARAFFRTHGGSYRAFHADPFGPDDVFGFGSTFSRAGKSAKKKEHQENACYAVAQKASGDPRYKELVDRLVVRMGMERRQVELEITNLMLGVS